MMILIILMRGLSDIPVWAGAIVVIIFIFYKIKSWLAGNASEKNTIRPHNKPTQEKANDKIIVVSNVDAEQLKIVIQQFCNLYNRDGFDVLPKLVIDEGKFIITFPYDISFMHMCFFINYLAYPHAAKEFADYKPNIKGWCTTKQDEPWVIEDTAQQKILLYLHENDENYDNVYFTTESGKCFIVDFGKMDPVKSTRRKYPAYENPPGVTTIAASETILFE